MSAQTANEILEKYAGGRGDIIPILQKLQDSQGFLSPELIKAISRKLRVSENEIYGVATFYAQFRFNPPGEHSVHVCMGTACHVRGGQQLVNELERRLGIEEGQTTPDKKFDLNRVACLGCCALAPVVKVDEKIYSQMSVQKLGRMMDEYEQA